MERIEVAVIGGGVTGLASALAIAEQGRTVCVLERHRRAGLETSTHNSGVIHAGLYYPLRGQGRVVLRAKLHALNGLGHVLEQRRQVQRARRADARTLRRAMMVGFTAPYTGRYETNSPPLTPP